MRLVLLTLLCWSAALRADDALVAVATNFIDTAEALARDFESVSSGRVTMVAGSTGKLYVQVLNGAPFDAFLAADELRPAKLEEAGLAVAGSRFTYATGRLAVISADPSQVLDSAAATLRASTSGKLAIANPALAPYGAAAMEVLDALGLRALYADRIVQGENVGQAYALAATGNARLGLVALSLVMQRENAGHYVAVDPALHGPIRQDAVLLRHGRDNGAAKAFLDFLGSERARRLIAARGYDGG